MPSRHTAMLRRNRRAASNSRWRSTGRAAYVAGTFDTKGRELIFLRQCLEQLGLRVVTVDSVHQPASRRRPACTRARWRATIRRATRPCSPATAAAPSRDGRGLRALHPHAPRLGGIISAGGSGGTALATPAMRALPIGVPKVMVSTVASGDVTPYVGPTDICMMYSVTDVQGINRISEQVLSNAAHALAGMIAHRRAPRRSAQAARIGLTMFGVTTPCVQAVDQAAGGRLRLPGLPRHRHRRPVDGEAGRLAACSPA